jgi:hypothetical protein
MLSQINAPTAVASKKEQPKYTFTSDDSAKAFPKYNSLKTKDNLIKWGMHQNMYMKRFHYDQVLRQQYDSVDSFLLQFFNSPNVNPHIKTKSGSGWGTLCTAEGIQIEKVTSTTTSLDVFDHLVANRDIIRADGEIKKCFGTIYLPHICR